MRITLRPIGDGTGEFPRVFEAVLFNQVVGWIQTTINMEEVEIWVFVYPSFRRRGIAREMLRLLREQYPKHCFSAKVSEGDIALNALFAKAEFKPLYNGYWYSGTPVMLHAAC